MPARRSRPDSLSLALFSPLSRAASSPRDRGRKKKQRETRIAPIIQVEEERGERGERRGLARGWRDGRTPGNQKKKKKKKWMMQRKEMPGKGGEEGGRNGGARRRGSCHSFTFKFVEAQRDERRAALDPDDDDEVRSLVLAPAAVYRCSD